MSLQFWEGWEAHDTTLEVHVVRSLPRGDKRCVMIITDVDIQFVDHMSSSAAASLSTAQSNAGESDPWLSAATRRKMRRTSRWAHNRLLGVSATDEPGGFELRFRDTEGDTMHFVCDDGKSAAVNALRRLCRIMVDNNAAQLASLVDSDSVDEGSASSSAAPAATSVAEAAASESSEQPENLGSSFFHFGARQSKLEEEDAAAATAAKAALEDARAPALPHVVITDADVERSAALVDAAFSGSFVDPNDVQIGNLVWIWRLRHVDRVSRGLYLALAFFETPPWKFSGRHRNGSEFPRPGFGLPYLPKWASLPIELVLLGFIALSALLKMLAVGRFSFCKDHLNTILLALIAVCTFCAIGDAVMVWSVWERCAAVASVSCRTPAWVDWFFSPRALLRPSIFVLASPQLRRLTMIVLRTIPKLLEVFLFVALLVIFFAVAGVFLFRDDVFADVPTEASKYFVDFQHSIVNLFELLTTANNPDIMMPAYTQWRGWFVFFSLFIIIGIFFLMNIVLATVVTQFKAAMNRAAGVFYAARIASLRSAFRLLTGDLPEQRTVSRETIYRLLGQLRRLGRIPSLPDYALALMIDVRVCATTCGCVVCCWSCFVFMILLLSSLSFKLFSLFLLLLLLLLFLL